MSYIHYVYFLKNVLKCFSSKKFGLNLKNDDSVLFFFFNFEVALDVDN